MSTTAHGQLRRSLKQRHIVFIGLAYMSPFAVFDTFGIVSEATRGHVPMSYIIVTIAVLFTAFSYAKMSRVYPSAGSAYTFTRRTMGAPVGFMVGWLALLDYLFLPMINALLAKIYLSAQFPDVPGWIWIVGLITVITALNIIGARISAVANMVMVIFQVLLALVFVILTVRAVLSDNALAFTFVPFYSASAEITSLVGGASVLALAFLGFDAVTTLSEEAVNPRRTIPRAIMWISALGAAFFVTITYVMQSLVPDEAALAAITPDSEGASPYIALFIGGIVFQTIFLVGATVSVVSSGLASQLSASRLLFAMGRDGIIPERVFGFIHSRFGTPVLNIIVVGMIALTALILDLNAATSLINFGAFTAFAFANLSVIVYWIRHRRRTQIPGSVLGWTVVPAIGVLINVWLWVSLDQLALTTGLVWGAIGLLWLLWLTRGFRRAAPEVAFDEAEDLGTGTVRVQTGATRI